MANIFGWMATFLFLVCYIPQMIKTYNTKTVSGLNLSDTTKKYYA